MRARQLDFVAALCLIAICSATVWAEEAPTYAPEKVAAVATDEVVTPTPSDVAREVVRLQEEMGGSITAGFGSSPAWTPSMSAPRPEPYVPAAKSPVQALRAVSWQLEQAAHRLESLDLYDQADALRQAANRLRMDAREMKAASRTPKSK